MTRARKPLKLLFKGENMLYELKITRKFQYTLYHNRTPIAHYKTKKDAKTALLVVRKRFELLDKLQNVMKIQTNLFCGDTYLNVYQYCPDFEIKHYFKIKREQIA